MTIRQQRCHVKKIISLILIIFILRESIVANLKSAESDCNKNLLEEFRELYFGLQSALNYENKEAKYKNGKLTLTPLEKNSPYQGKLFEEAIYKEYKNALIKVARLYQLTKYEEGTHLQPNERLVKFIKMIDPKNQDELEKINKNDKEVEYILNAVISTSKLKFKNKDTAFALNDNDEYLLRNLIAHARDRVASLAHYRNTGKGTQHFDDKTLKKLHQEPLTKLLAMIQESSIKKDDILKLEKLPNVTMMTELTSEKLGALNNDAVHSAVAQEMQKLKRWAQKNQDCWPLIRSREFQATLQPYIQHCNYNYFIDALIIPDNKTKNLEAVLHFINANEKFLNRPTPIAETALDEKIFDSVKIPKFVPNAPIPKSKPSMPSQEFESNPLANIANAPSCTQLRTSSFETPLKTQTEAFVQSANLPDIFQTIKCYDKNGKVEKNVCIKNMTLTTDPLGRGFKIQQTKSDDSSQNPELTVAFSEDNPCQIKLNHLAWTSEKEATYIRAIQDKPEKKKFELKPIFALPGFNPFNTKSTINQTAKNTPAAEEKIISVEELPLDKCGEKDEAYIIVTEGKCYLFSNPVSNFFTTPEQNLDLAQDEKLIVTKLTDNKNGRALVLTPEQKEQNPSQSPIIFKNEVSVFHPQKQIPSPKISFTSGQQNSAFTQSNHSNTNAIPLVTPVEPTNILTEPAQPNTEVIKPQSAPIEPTIEPEPPKNVDAKEVIAEAEKEIEKEKEKETDKTENQITPECEAYINHYKSKLHLNSQYEMEETKENAKKAKCPENLFDEAEKEHRKEYDLESDNEEEDDSSSSRRRKKRFHFDPMKPSQDQLRSFNPMFNPMMMQPQMPLFPPMQAPPMRSPYILYGSP